MWAEFIVDPGDLGLNRARKILVDEFFLRGVRRHHGIAVVGMTAGAAAKVAGDHAVNVDPQLLVKGKVIGVDPRPTNIEMAEKFGR